MPADFADDLRAIGDMTIADPYCTPSGSIRTSASVFASMVARALTQATSGPTVKDCSPTAPTGAKSTENGTGAAPGTSNALLLNARNELTVAP